MLHLGLRYQLFPINNPVAVDENAELHEHDMEHVDYSAFSKSQLLEEIKKSQSLNPAESFSKAKRIKSVADEIHSNNESVALEKYLEDGGDKDSFEFKDADYENICEYFKRIRENFVNYSNDQKNQRENNFKLKDALLNELREIVNQEETQESHQRVKKIQEEWKNIGQVASDKASDLYNNYSALLNRYYDQKSIYYQFKELDRKRNLDLKTRLCEKAEELLQSTSIITALKELTNLHSEYKSIGPVPKEFQESLWNRLKAASDTLYLKRKEYQENIDKEYSKNLDLKQEILKEVEAFANYTSTKIEQWQKKSDEITLVKEKWAKVGFVAKDASKDLNKTFWGFYKKFFHNKGDFFKAVHSERQNNLNQKLHLLELAQKVLETGVVNEANIEEIKSLQKQWKDVGPTFYKKGNEVYDKFKKTCDDFFNIKRGADAEKEKSFEVNFVRKNEYCESLESSKELKQFNTVLKEWESLGLVPKKDIGNAKARLLKAWETHIDTLVSEQEENVKLKLMAQVELLKDSPDGKNKLFTKEKNLKQKIQTLENDIVTLGNNLEFFAKSKNADALKVDILKKIEAGKVELEKLKQQYKLLRNI